MVSVTLTEKIPTKNGDVQLDVDIGSGQDGTTCVFLDDVLVTSANGKYALGKKLQGKRAVIQTIVTDINPETNETVITYTFKEGEAQVSFSNQATVSQNGQMAHYLCTADFT